MVNLDVDGYIKALNHRKTNSKTTKNQQPAENQNNIKTEI